jgi:hypothetical protein
MAWAPTTMVFRRARRRPAAPACLLRGPQQFAEQAQKRLLGVGHCIRDFDADPGERVDETMVCRAPVQHHRPQEGESRERVHGECLTETEERRKPRRRRCRSSPELSSTGKSIASGTSYSGYAGHCPRTHGNYGLLLSNRTLLANFRRISTLV